MIKPIAFYLHSKVQFCKIVKQCKIDERWLLYHYWLYYRFMHHLSISFSLISCWDWFFFYSQGFPPDFVPFGISVHKELYPDPQQWNQRLRGSIFYIWWDSEGWGFVLLIFYKNLVRKFLRRIENTSTSMW